MKHRTVDEGVSPRQEGHGPDHLATVFDVNLDAIEKT
jgi:hypothetical protein